MTPTMYFEVDGTPVRADECTWVKIAPCGCECAWSLAKYTPTEDGAWDDFSPSKAMRRRDERLGYTVQIKRHSDIRIKDDCPHTPRFGVEPRPQPEGHTWAGTHDGRVLHLVPIVIEQDDHSGLRRDEQVASICGRASAFIWSTQWHIVDGRTECAGCLTAAKKELRGER